jgi:hypothetical protein
MSLYSNRNYRSAISTPEAIGAATRMKADMHSVTVHDLSNVAHIYDESQVLHAAACIVRRQISNITISDENLTFITYMGYIAQIMNSYRIHVCFDACSSTNSFRS